MMTLILELMMTAMLRIPIECDHDAETEMKIEIELKAMIEAQQLSSHDYNAPYMAMNVS